MKLFIVGNWRGASWEFAGVFSNEDAARAQCIDGTYFVGPAELDQVLPHESREWPGVYYPNVPQSATLAAIAEKTGADRAVPDFVRVENVEADGEAAIMERKRSPQ